MEEYILLTRHMLIICKFCPHDKSQRKLVVKQLSISPSFKAVLNLKNFMNLNNKCIAV